ncbi:MAG: hypothetical protein LUH08_02505, partial [Ruminococcus sp.]|nr:hypothetical protein [Ruminococcus sp.]
IYTMKNGWTRVKNDVMEADVYVEDGKVLRGTNIDHTQALYPFKWYKSFHAWLNVSGVKYDTFRKGFKEGRYSLK